MTINLPSIADWTVAAYAPHGQTTPMHSRSRNGQSSPSSARPRERRLTGLWRFDPAKGAWERVALPAGGAFAGELAAAQVHFRAGRPMVVDLADRSSLYWVEWREEGQRRGTLVDSTPVRDGASQPGTPPSGSAAPCVACPALTPAPFVPRSARRPAVPRILGDE